MHTAVGGITARVDVEAAAVGLIVARGCQPATASMELTEELARAIAVAQERTDVEGTTRAVRDLLRHGAYKPTGRGKPASEYLLNAARENRFPRVSTLVDINNLISLRSLLPISLIDLERIATDDFVIRRGQPGESYVFNPAGQSIDLEDLLLIAALPGDRPCATPVKDSLEAKLDEQSREVLAVLYAPLALMPELQQATSEFVAALRRWSGAPSIVSASVAGGGRPG